MSKRLFWACACVAAVACVLAGTAGATSFTNTVLRAPFTGFPPGFSSNPPNQSGDSEPAIAFGGAGGRTMAVDGLGWLPFAVNLWKGHFGDMPPAFFGPMDTTLPIQGKGRVNVGDGDADVVVTSAGTTLLADLDIVFTAKGTHTKLGVSVTRCPASATGPSGCTSTLVDATGADRPWITNNGTTAWLSYHDSQNSSIIRTWKSTDDGRTWQASGAPLNGLGNITGGSTFNNIQGPIVADPKTGNVYDVFAGGEPQTKCCSANYNNIYVARSTDGGAHYTAALVFHAAPFTALDNIFPSLAVDPVTGNLYAVWSDGSSIWESTSTDHGSTWSMALKVSTTATSLMPWVAARNGKVDIVYYGSAQAQNDPSAVWNVYDSQIVGGSLSISTVSNVPNRVGAVCTSGTGCVGGVNRELLDLFEVAEDPVTGRAAIIFTNTTFDTWTSPVTGTHQLPEIVLAYEQ
jgi:hypothetical protein